MPQPPYQRVVVVGVGLIGGSVALALRERGLAKEVVGVVRSAESKARLEELGLVDRVTTDHREAFAGAQVIVVATPVGAIVSEVARALEEATNGALITDAGSTKAEIVALTRGSTEREDAPAFIGAHPLAGDHRSGPEAARADLLEGATTVITPTFEAGELETTRDGVRGFWEALGSNVIEMLPARHDELLALTSHVPHVAAAAVAATTPAEALPLAATGWADTTRVAAGSALLWREILLANRAPIAGGLRQLIKELEAYAAALDSGDGDTLERMLEEGRLRRDALGS